MAEAVRVTHLRSDNLRSAELSRVEIEPHTAESQWQSCNCQSCQDKRRLILSAKGEKLIDFKVYRRKDEKY